MTGFWKIAAAMTGLLLATPAAAEPTIADYMRDISTDVGALGSVHWKGFVHDSSTGADGTYTRSVHIWDFKPDPAACRLSFRFEQTTSDKSDGPDADAGIPFDRVTEVKVETLDEEMPSLDAQAGHSNLSGHTEPTIWVVSAIRADGTRNDFDFYSQNVAERVAHAERRISGLCHNR